jgi:hypothetical protein
VTPPRMKVQLQPLQTLTKSESLPVINNEVHPILKHINLSTKKSAKLL